MNWQEFLALLMLATTMCLTPGPNTTLAAALGANGGLARAFHFILAVPLGWTLVFLLCALGGGALVMAVPVLRWLLKLAGIGYLLWLAWRLAQSARLTEADAPSLTIGFWHGVRLQFVNVKAWLLALSLVAGWIAGQPDAVARFMIVAPVMLLYAFFGNLLYALAGTLMRRWLARGRRLLWFNRTMGALLALTALRMAWA